jgi:hypothetical protein
VIFGKIFFYMEFLSAHPFICFTLAIIPPPFRLLLSLLFLMHPFVCFVFALIHSSLPLFNSIYYPLISSSVLSLSLSIYSIVYFTSSVSFLLSFVVTEVYPRVKIEQTITHIRIRPNWLYWIVRRSCLTRSDNIFLENFAVIMDTYS